VAVPDGAGESGEAGKGNGSDMAGNSAVTDDIIPWKDRLFNDDKLLNVERRAVGIMDDEPANDGAVARDEVREFRPYRAAAYAGVDDNVKVAGMDALADDSVGSAGMDGDSIPESRPDGPVRIEIRTDGGNARQSSYAVKEDVAGYGRETVDEPWLNEGAEKDFLSGKDGKTDMFVASDLNRSNADKKSDSGGDSLSFRRTVSGNDNANVSQSTFVSRNDGNGMHVNSSSAGDQIERAHVARQLEQGITDAVRMNRNKAVLHLNPPELGSVKIRLSVYGGHEIKAVFITDNPDTRHLIESSLGTLKTQLVESGYALGSASVDVGQHEMFSGQNGQQYFARSGRQGVVDESAQDSNSFFEPGDEENHVSRSGVYRVM
jgi:hypothetical protein